MDIENKVKELCKITMSSILSKEKYNKAKGLTIGNQISDLINQKLKEIYSSIYDYSIQIYLLEKGSTYIFHKTSCLFDSSNDKHFQQWFENENWICISSIFLFWNLNRQLTSNKINISDLKTKIRKVCQYKIRKLLKNVESIEDFMHDKISFFCEYIRDIIHIDSKNFAKGLECLIMKNDSHGGSTCWNKSYNDMEDTIVIYSTQHSGFWCIFFVTLIRHT